jgi:beta-glucanase (GH16 family)
MFRSSASRRLFPALASLAVASLLSAGTIDPSKLQMTWSDEFSGTTLDTTKWQAADNEVRQGNSRWRSNQVSVANGQLRIGIQKVNDPTIKYECGAVRTRKDYKVSQTLFQQKFGYFETRLKLPANIGADYWAAFWMMAGNVSDTVSDTRQGTEIDIMESFNYDKPGEHRMTFHWNGYGTKHNAAGVSCGAQPQLLDHGFHSYGFYWDENWYIGYLDGVEVGRTNMIGLGSSATGKTLSQGTCLQPGYLLLSVEADLWPGTSSNWDPVMPAEDEFLVDYVRVYAVPEPTALAYIAVTTLLALARPPKSRPAC